MGDRVAVMKDGHLQQVDTPLSLYDKPVNLFVAGFIGSPQMNLLEAHAKDGRAQIGEFLVPVDETAARRMKGKITVGVRPEAWRIVGANDGGLPVRATVVEELDDDAFTAVARMIRYAGRPTGADLAVTVIDGWQGRCVATALLAELMRQRPVGVNRIVTAVAADNCLDVVVDLSDVPQQGMPGFIDSRNSVDQLASHLHSTP